MSASGLGQGFEGVLLAVCDAVGRAVPDEGRILRSLAESRASGEAEGEARGLAEGLLVGRSTLLHLLAHRFGSTPPELEARVARLDATILLALTDAAIDISSLAAFVQALDGLER